MTQAKHGDKVRIDLVGTLEDGTVFQSTLAADACDDDDCGCDDDDCGHDHADDQGCGCASGPVEVQIGAGEIFPQIEQALIGMAPGETRSVTIAAADAFGVLLLRRAEAHLTAGWEYTNALPRRNVRLRLFSEAKRAIVEVRHD